MKSGRWNGIEDGRCMGEMEHFTGFDPEARGHLLGQETMVAV